jgi:hypothetical protein
MMKLHWTNMVCSLHSPPEYISQILKNHYYYYYVIDYASVNRFGKATKMGTS